MQENTTCMFTGHRVIAVNEYKLVCQKLHEKIMALIGMGVTDFIAGGAIGFDTVAAEAVLNLKEHFPHIRLHLYIPCINHNSKWSMHDIERYNAVAARADEILYVTNDTYKPNCMKLRNMKMVDDSKYCIAYYKYGRSGTMQTVNYAKKMERVVVNIAPQSNG